ncbi:zinc-ribbon domain-containing protein [Acetobacterium wieringae]|uniref:zinc-ribbon domain-containing protein n=1 Tax=Acetobacterium wieringae TaxID=52694 RepID=UPI003158E05B
MRCKKCGSENQETSKFCDKCGTAMGEPPYQTVQSGNTFMGRIKKMGYEKTRAIINGSINVILIICFFFLSWVKIDSAMASNWTGSNVAFKGSAFRLLMLITSGTNTLNQYIPSSTGTGYLKLGYLYLAIPMLVIVSFLMLFRRSTSLNDFFLWSNITYIVTITMITIMILTKNLIFMYYNLDVYQSAVNMSFGAGAILSILFSIFGLLLSKILPVFLTKDVNMNDVKNTLNGSIDGAKSNFANKFSDNPSGVSPAGQSGRGLQPNQLQVHDLEITLENGEMIIQNRSKNGPVHLNGDVLDTANFYELINGDVIRCGNANITIKIEKEPEKTIITNPVNMVDSDLTVMMGSEI